MSHFQQNLQTDERTDGKTDGQTLFYGTLPAKAGVPVKDEAYMINFDQYESIGTHWIALYVDVEKLTYFDSFGVEHIPKEFTKFIGNNIIITNIYRMQVYNSITCGYFFIGFIDFMLQGKSLLKYTNLFCPNKYKTNDQVILKYFQ